MKLGLFFKNIKQPKLFLVVGGTNDDRRNKITEILCVNINYGFRVYHRGCESLVFLCDDKKILRNMSFEKLQNLAAGIPILPDAPLDIFRRINSGVIDLTSQKPSFTPRISRL